VNPTPGEIPLAKHAVLYLDESPGFRRSKLDIIWRASCLARSVSPVGTASV
jgi:hypothetical protein